VTNNPGEKEKAVTYAQAVILGIVQGLSEFLPVSSSGHLVLVQHFFGFTESLIDFDIFVHFGTLLAVVVVFRASILRLITGFAGDIRAVSGGSLSPADCLRESKSMRMVAAILIGTVPAAVVGITMKDGIEALFGSILPVLCALFVTGIILIATFFARRGSSSVGPAGGLLIGIAQALAIVPGISRSGATISTALFLGVKREEAGEFSFLLSIPAVSGATLLAFMDTAGKGFGAFTPGVMIAGTAAAFLSGWVSLVILMRIVKRGKIGWFGFYCLAVSAAGLILYVTGGGGSAAGNMNGQTGHAMTVETTSIPSSFDGAEQNIRYLRAVEKRRPLVVALHTWSHDYRQDDVSAEYFDRCRARDWNCIFPDFRGANNTPAACGSEAAMRDILDAVEWAMDEFAVDPRRIFLVGASGGGHMTLQTASHYPSTWTAVSAWVPISDIARWHRETTERGMAYAEHVELCCGGPPGSSAAVDGEYRSRSPLIELWRAHIVPTDINAGIHDGHGGTFGGAGSVPVGHSVRAFNELAKAAGRTTDIIPEDAIAVIEKEERIPESVTTETREDPDYGRDIHLRRQSGLARLTLFEGGHEIIYDAAFAWFERF